MCICLSVTPCKSQTERNGGYSTEVNDDRASFVGRLGAWAVKAAWVEEYNRYSGSKGLCAMPHVLLVGQVLVTVSLSTSSSWCLKHCVSGEGSDILGLVDISLSRLH